MMHPAILSIALAVLLGSGGTAGVTAADQPAGTGDRAIPTTGFASSVQHVSVGYDVDIRLQPDRRRMLATLRLDIRNTSGGPITHVVLHSFEQVPLRVREAQVDGRRTSVSVRPGTIDVELDRDLAAGSSVPVRLDVVLPLGRPITGTGYFHAWRDGVVQVAEWLPRADAGLTRSIKLRIRAPRGMVVAVGSLENARDLPIVASRTYHRLSTTVGRTRLSMLYATGGRDAAAATLRQARSAFRWIERRLGSQPRTRMTIAQVNSHDLAYAWPGIIWLPDDLTPRELRVYVAHELAHQWFGGIVANGGRNVAPFTNEAPAELVSRLYRDAFRPSTCPGRRLDLPKSAYGSCLYEAIYIDGANILDRVRRRMGDAAFWRSLRGYLREHRFHVVTLRDLIDALRDASSVDLDPLLRRRFPSIVH